MGFAPSNFYWGESGFCWSNVFLCSSVFERVSTIIYCNPPPASLHFSYHLFSGSPTFRTICFKTVVQQCLVGVQYFDKNHRPKYVDLFPWVLLLTIVIALVLLLASNRTFLTDSGLLSSDLRGPNKMALELHKGWREGKKSLEWSMERPSLLEQGHRRIDCRCFSQVRTTFLNCQVVCILCLITPLDRNVIIFCITEGCLKDGGIVVISWKNHCLLRSYTQVGPSGWPKQ